MRSGNAAAALAVGFGSSVAMWSAGFLGRIPQAPLPGYVVILVLALLVVAGGARIGRVPGAGIGTGALAGLFASLINLLVLGSALGPGAGDSPGAMLAVVTTLPAGALLGALGARLAGGRPPKELDATSTLARVAAVATVVLVLAGGLVTSQDAGLAVVDWPNSFGYPMFLFPLARMVGGVFYEHSHRLLGSLVGLLTLVLAVRLLVTEPRRPVRALGLAALALVILQGILGGLRVTGHFTWSTSAEVTRPSLALAMVHGATGQIVLALLTALAAATSRTWRDAPRPSPGEMAPGADRMMPALAVLAILVQLLLGIRLRHLGEGVMLHLTFAMVVLGIVVAAAVRATARYGHLAPIRKSAAAFLAHGITQVVLGGVALMAVTRAREVGSGAFDVIAATAHQTLGAMLLANAVLLAVWCRRLLPAPEPAAEAVAVPGRP